MRTHLDHNHARPNAIQSIFEGRDKSISDGSQWSTAHRRELLNPGISFFGNAVFYSLSKSLADTLAASDEAPVHSLAEICDHITHSQSTSVINSRHIAEVYQLIDHMKDYRSLFVGWDLFRSRDLTITNWADIDLYGVSFGDVLGKPKFVRLPQMEADGVALILPRQRDASQEVLEIMIMLRCDHMGALEKDSMWQTILSHGRKDGDELSIDSSD
ncbi:uncharacterized protein N7500_007492 [Penicillium coprophilum]|uniref:uncharacterized protein n=1 Tax=Penicillium coprophilum TaxID=36646 RepID=UPI00238AC860|nr:uncharacterized protein N7500_007492 [Penicillium coprophilum]KAJ5165662.1 hypothetical protein N7500_007492 [Penicillium coprophilum]